MGRNRGPLLIVLSLLLAAGAAWVANKWVQARTMPATASEPATVPVVVAALDIPFGTRVEGRHLTTIQMLRGSHPSGVFNEPQQVEGRVARASLITGEILLQERFVDQLTGSTLAAVVEKNMRAVAVRVDDVVGVAGFLLPGNRVDVLGSRDTGRGEAVTETILQNVRVLAVDQTAATDKNTPVVVRAVTLEVTPEQAEVLVKWKEQGSIQLTLRNPLDEEVQEKARPARAVVRRPAPRRQQEPVITVIRGTSVASQDTTY